MQGAQKFAPACWKRHRDAGESVPIDWPHTLAAVYQFAQLVHGHKPLIQKWTSESFSARFATSPFLRCGRIRPGIVSMCGPTKQDSTTQSQLTTVSGLDGTSVTDG